MVRVEVIAWLLVIIIIILPGIAICVFAAMVVFLPVLAVLFAALATLKDLFLGKS